MHLRPFAISMLIVAISLPPILGENTSQDTSLTAQMYGKMYQLGPLDVYIMPETYQVHGPENVSYLFTLTNPTKSPQSVDISANGALSNNTPIIDGNGVKSIWLNMTASGYANESCSATFRCGKNVTHIPFSIEIAHPKPPDQDSLSISQASTSPNRFKYTAIGEKIRFYQRDPYTLANFSTAGGWVSFTPAKQVSDIKVTSNVLTANTPDYATKYEIISSNLVKNTLTLENPVQCITEYMHYSKNIAPHPLPDGRIEFRRIARWSGTVFSLLTPAASDANNRPVPCNYMVFNDTLRLIVNSDPLTHYPVIVDPTWEDTGPDWDNGIKSNSSGRWETETDSDNPLMGAGLELANAYGYSYTYTHDDIDIWPWIHTEGSGVNGDVNATEAGALYYSAPPNTGEEFCLASASKVISGDIDYRIKFALDSFATGANYNTLIQISIRDPDNNHQAFIELIYYSGYSKPKIHANTQQSNSWGGDKYAQTSATDIAFRISRVGSAVYIYYNLTGVIDGAWTLLKSDASWVSTAMRAQLNLEAHWRNNPSTNAGLLYEYQLNATITNTVYRTAGTWSKELTIENNMTIGNWTVEAEIPSNCEINVSWWQNGIEVARKDGVTSLSTITDADLTSGSFDDFEHGQFTYRLELSGNGTATPKLIMSYGDDNERPAAQFILYGMNLTDNSTDDGTITNWTWLIESDTWNETLYGQYQELVLPEGVYNVSLTVTDNEGATGSTYQLITIGGSSPNITIIQGGVSLYDVFFTALIIAALVGLARHLLAI